MGKFSKFLQWLLDPKASRLRKNTFFSMAAVVVFATTYMLILPAITKTTDTYCGHAEHQHTESCYKEGKKLVCDKKEQEGHAHSDDCYDWVEKLICGESESEGHSHSDSCYETIEILTCDNEDPEHEHSEDCYTKETQLVCEKSESKGHTHNGDCYEKEKVLVCGKKERKGHEHSAKCYKETKTLDCKKNEHTHTLSCYSNPKADVESAKTWEKSVKRAKLTGDWSKDVIAVAKTQMGYTESTRNYQVNSDGKKKGYSRYGDWYGVTYGDWCAMFVSFCLDYAGVDESLMPQEAGCQNWIKKLNTKKQPYYYAVNDDNNYKLVNRSKDYEMEIGDIVFFNWDNEPDADHVGLISDITYNDDGSM